MSEAAPRYNTVEDTIGNTPLVRLVRVAGADCDNVDIEEQTMSRP